MAKYSPGMAEFAAPAQTFNVQLPGGSAVVVVDLRDPADRFRFVGTGIENEDPGMNIWQGSAFGEAPIRMLRVPKGCNAAEVSREDMLKVLPHFPYEILLSDGGVGEPQPLLVNGSEAFGNLDATTDKDAAALIADGQTMFAGFDVTGVKRVLVVVDFGVTSSGAAASPAPDELSLLMYVGDAISGASVATQLARWAVPDDADQGSMSHIPDFLKTMTVGGGRKKAYYVDLDGSARAYAFAVGFPDPTTPTLDADASAFVYIWAVGR